MSSDWKKKRERYRKLAACGDRPSGPIDVESLPAQLKGPFLQWLQKYPDAKFRWGSDGGIIMESELARMERLQETP